LRRHWRNKPFSAGKRDSSQTKGNPIFSQGRLHKSLTGGDQKDRQGKKSEKFFMTFWQEGTAVAFSVDDLKKKAGGKSSRTKEFQ